MEAQLLTRLAQTRYVFYLEGGSHHRSLNTTMLGLLVTGLAVYLTARYFWRLRTMQNWTGLRSLFTPWSAPGALLPSSWWNPGIGVSWDRRRDFYKDSDVVSVIGFLAGNPFFFTRSVEILKQVVGQKTSFGKDKDAGAAFAIWGKNLLYVEDEDWKRHRKIVAPAFNQQTYTMVCEETARSYRSLAASERWREKQTVLIPNVSEPTAKVALFVIAACGFGVQLDWDEPPVAEGKMSVKECFRIVSITSVIRLAVPRWAYRLPIKALRDIETAYVTLRKFMDDEIATRKEDLKEGSSEEKRDIFSRLVEANEEETTRSARLDDSELIGNTFLMLLAGHDTTANTLAASIAFLALHEEEQEKIYKHIQTVLPDGRDPTLADIPLLDPVLCAFMEALRLYPAGWAMPRIAKEDTILRFPDNGKDTTLFVNKGTRLTIDMIGLHYNANLYPDPMEFKPSRWQDPADRNAFMAFSIGPRPCLGSKFSMTEGVCFLTLLLREWKLGVVLENGESKEEWRERVMWAKSEFVLKMRRPVPIQMTRR